jgi:PAS domain S-box-containing protein
MYIEFDKEQFNRLFPFHLILDAELKIIGAGKTLLKLYPIKLEDNFTDRFFIKRPQLSETNFQTLLSESNKLIILEATHDKQLILRGQFEYFEASRQLVFLGSPWFGSMEQVKERALSIHDFAHHDPLIDLLHVLKTQEIVNEEVKELLHTIQQQRNDLKRLSLVAEETVNAVIIADKDGNIDWVNKGFTRITGYSLSEVKGKRPGRLLQGVDTNPDTVQYLSEQLKKRLPFVCEILNYNKLGQPYWVRINGQPLFDKQHNLTGYFAVEEDITEEKEAEAKLQTSELRWKFALEGAGDGIWEFDFIERKPFYSDQYKRMLGYTPEEFIDEERLWKQHIHPDDLPLIDAMEKEYASGERIMHNRTYRIRQKNGSYIWILDRGMVIEKDPDGKPRKMIGIHTDISAQKKIEAELSRTSKRLTTLIGNMNSAIMVEDDQRRIVLANQNFCNMFQVPVAPEMLIGADCSQSAEQSKSFFANPDEFVRGVEGILLEQKPVLNEVMQMADGRVLERDYIPIFIDDQYHGHLWNYRDVTDAFGYRQRLQEQQKFYEQIMDNIPADIAVFDAEHTYLYLNPIAIKDPELRKWMIGKKDEDYCKLRNKPMSIAAARREKFLAVVASKTLNSWEETLVSPDGNTQHHLRNMFPVLNEKGEVILVIGYGLDITQRKQIEEQVAISEKRYKDLFRFSQALICTHDLQGRLLSVNPAICQTLGYEEQELIGRNLIEFMPDADMNQLRTGYLQEIAMEGSAKGVFTVQHKKGRQLNLLFQNYMMVEESSNPYVIGFAQDITDRVNAERELLLAKDLTEKAAEAKQIFLANMSHEIRTPMNGIIGVAAMLGKTKLNDQQKNYLHLITESARNLLVIVNDVLEIEKITAGKLELEQVPFDVLDKVNVAVQSFQFKAEEKGLQLSLITPKNTAIAVSGDPYRLGQILNNLLSNALKFTQQGRITVTVQPVRETAEKIMLQFEVEDTGIGIPEEKIQTIFDPFVQASTDISRKYGGTGLGLGICKNLIELQGGQLSVTSILNKGTKFSFYIPYVKTNTALAPDVVEQIQETALLKGKKVLLAEDVELNRMIARHMLEHWGMDVSVAVNGKEAVAMIEAQDFDLILMDILMPEMDGLEATAIIRNMTVSEKAHVPIIALTANAFKKDQENYLKAGVNAAVTKPYTEEELYGAIQKIFSSHQKKKDHKTKQRSKASKVTALYDLSMFDGIAGPGSEFRKKMVLLFLQTMPEDMQQLKQAYQDKNATVVYKTAHRMKPTIDTMGIVSLKEVIRRIEILGKEEVITTETGNLIETTERVLEEVYTQLKQQFNE